MNTPRLLIAALLTLSIAACGRQEPAATAPAEPSAASATAEKKMESFHGEHGVARGQEILFSEPRATP